MIDRRTLLGGSALTLAGFAAAEGGAGTEESPGFRYCLNTATIRGRKLGIEREIEVAAAAGYDGVEPWIGDVEKYRDAGGSLPDLRKKIADAGLAVESAIGFPKWIVDDPAVRAAGLEQAKREMALVRAIGGARVAAPPAGATKERLDLDAVAERYAALCDAGAEAGVVPQLEVWGFSATLSKLGEALYVAAGAARPNATLLLDAYHLHRGGGGFEGLRLLGPGAMAVFHLNDYPAAPARRRIEGRRPRAPRRRGRPAGGVVRDVPGDRLRGRAVPGTVQPGAVGTRPAGRGEGGLGEDAGGGGLEADSERFTNTRAFYGTV